MRLSLVTNFVDRLLQKTDFVDSKKLHKIAFFNSHAVGTGLWLWSPAFLFSSSFDHKYESFRLISHHKKVLENFRKFISQEPHIGLLIWNSYCLYFKLLFTWQSGTCSTWSKYDLYNNRNYENRYLCSLATFRWWNMFAECLLTIQFRLIQAGWFKI